MTNHTATHQKAILRRLNQQAAAMLLSISPRTLRDRDVPRNDDGTYDAVVLVARLLTEKQSRLPVDDEDHATRKLRAEADIKEMEAEQRAGALVPLAMVDTTLTRVADMLRQLGEDFGRTTAPINGRDAQKRLNDAIGSLDFGD